MQSPMEYTSFLKINILPAAGFGMAAIAVSLLASDAKLNASASDIQRAVVSEVNNVCKSGIAERNPRPFLFIGCGVE